MTTLLCPDVIAGIFSYLTPSDLLGSCARVNQVWFAILFEGKHDYLWKLMCSGILNNSDRFEFVRDPYSNRKEIEQYCNLIGRDKLCSNWMDLFFKLFKPLYALSNKYHQSLEDVRHINRDGEDILSKEEPHRFVENIRRESCLKIVLDAEDCENLEIGASKYDGFPDLPDGYQWPINTKGLGYIFLSQLNLQDLQLFHSGKGVLPNEGWLYFFVDYEEHAAPGNTVCFYWNGPIENLKTAQSPPPTLVFERIVKNSRKITFREDIDLFTENTRQTFGHLLEGELGKSLVNISGCQLFGRPLSWSPDVTESMHPGFVFLMHDLSDGVCVFSFFLNTETMTIKVEMHA